MITIPVGLYNKKKVETLPIIYAGLTGGITQIAKSTDSGETWQAQSTSLNGNPTCFDKDNLGNIYCVTDTGYIYKNWIEYYPSIGETLYFTKYINGYLYFSSNSHLWRIDNNFNIETIDVYNYKTYNVIYNLSFTSGGIIGFNSNIIQSGNFTAACDAGNGFIYAGTADGHIWLNSTVNDFSAWIDITLGWGSNYPISVIVKSNNKFIISDVHRNTYIVDDIFTSFTNSIGLDVGFVEGMIAVNDGILLASTSSGYIYKSIDNGTNWSEISGNPQFSATSINALIKI